MEIILLERIEKLGQMGDVVSVKPGYARNFLLPHKKAVTATKANKEYFEGQRNQLEAQNLEQKKDAEAVGAKLEGLFVSMARQAGDTGQLYGSVNARDISAGITEAGFSVTRSQVSLNKPIKTVGLHEVKISLHPEVAVTVTANVARSDEEAKIQERTGEAVDAAPDAEVMATAEEMFDENSEDASLESSDEVEAGVEAGTDAEVETEAKETGDADIDGKEKDA